MSLCREEGSGRVLGAGLLVMLAVFLVTAALAQEETTPKVEIFTGYQWLHPGETIPTPVQSPTSPVPMKLSDMPSGLGAGLTYNFNRHWGLEGDYGENWNAAATETTVSAGPRLMWRDRKSTRLNSSHVRISYAVFCLKKKKIDINVHP